MEVAKIQFSPTEIELVNNVDIILTKNEVLKKIKGLLSIVQQLQLDYIKKNDLELHPLFSVPPKISRGENYLGFPYLILDFPRISSPEDFFFIRLFFWWGHFFSSTLHSKGKSKKLMFDTVFNRREQLRKSGYYISVNSDPWVHHFDSTNYQSVESIADKDWINYWKTIDHIKIAAKSPLQEWQFNAANLFENWYFLLTLSGLIA